MVDDLCHPWCIKCMWEGKFDPVKHSVTRQRHIMSSLLIEVADLISKLRVRVILRGEKLYEGLLKRAVLAFEQVLVDIEYEGTSPLKIDI